MSEGPLLEISNLSWGVEGKAILREISFDLSRGQFVGLIGPNGAGKSSLMRCIYRVNKPSKGEISFEGKNVWQQNIKESAKSTAVILQENGAHEGLTVYEIVALGLTPHKRLFERDTDSDRVRIRKILDEVDLLSFRHDLFGHLSGGEKQRVMLARAILQNPKLLVMDEPTNHLDVHYQIDVLQKVKDLNITVLASFHDLNLASAFCDWILVLNQGKLVASGTPIEVLTQDLIQQVFNTRAVVDEHPTQGHPRISYAYRG